MSLVDFAPHDLRDPKINYLYEEGIACLGFALSRGNHEVGWLEITMDDSTRFSRGQSPGRLDAYFKRQRRRQWTFPSHAFFERLSLHELHDIETVAVLLAIISDLGDIGMMQSRCRTCLAQEPRASGRISCPLRVDDFKGDCAFEDCISRTIRNAHCSGTEFYRIAVRTKFNFKMSIARWSLHRDLAFQREGKTSQTAQTFPVWTAGYQEPTANDAGFCRLCPALLRCPADRTVLGPRHVVGASGWVSGDEYPVKIFQLIVDLCRVGYGACHLSSQRVAITLAQA